MKRTKLMIPIFVLASLSLFSCNTYHIDESIDESQLLDFLNNKPDGATFFDLRSYCQKKGFKFTYTLDSSSTEYYGAMKDNVIWKKDKESECLYVLEEDEEVTYCYPLSNEEVIDGPTTYDAAEFEQIAFEKAFSVLNKYKEDSKFTDGYETIETTTYLDQKVDVKRREYTIDNVKYIDTYYVAWDLFGSTLKYTFETSVRGGEPILINQTIVTSILQEDDVVPPLISENS